MALVAKGRRNMLFPDAAEEADLTCPLRILPLMIGRRPDTAEILPDFSICSVHDRRFAEADARYPLAAKQGQGAHDPADGAGKCGARANSFGQTAFWNVEDGKRGKSA